MLKVVSGSDSQCPECLMDYMTQTDDGVKDKKCTGCGNKYVGWSIQHQSD